MIGDFNAKSELWCKINKISFEGSQLLFLMLKFGLLQIMNEPTYILENSRSWIVSLFTYQNNMVMDSGVHFSLFLHSHYQIIFANFGLKVFYPPAYEWTVLQFFQANSKCYWSLLKAILNDKKIPCIPPIFHNNK